MSEKEKNKNRNYPESSFQGGINIKVTPQNVFVNVAISDTEGKLIIEFNLSPFDALSIANSITDASIIARVEAMIQEQLNERK